MNNKYGIKLLLLIIAFSIYNFCCTNDKDTDCRGGEQSVKKLPHKYYSPLTLLIYNDIKDNKQTFERFYLHYSKQYDCDQTGKPQKTEIITITPRDAKTDIAFNSINNYTAIFTKRYKGLLNEPDNYKDQQKEFSKDDIGLILTYLEKHADFFFNNREFQGVNFPYEFTFGSTLCCARSQTCQYSFLLEFFEPPLNGKDRGNYAWIICKCEEQPDTVFQGLIDIFENDFITKFEAQ